MEILDKARHGKKKTELMSEVGISYMQSKQYFSILKERELLNVDADQLYKTTKIGVDFLERCGDCFLCDWHQQKPAKRSVKKL
jgi:predicted transcriptional regulator